MATNPASTRTTSTHTTSQRDGTTGRSRRLLPVGVILSVYVLVGTLWIFGGGPVADTVAASTTIPRWVVELAKGMLFVAITTLALSVSMRHLTEQLDTAQAHARDRTRELEASRLQLQALFDHALDAIGLADGDGRYIAVNPAFCELTGYSEDQLLDMGPGDLAAGRQQAADAVTRLHASAHDGTGSGVFTLRHGDGHVVETEYRAVPDIQPGVHLSVLRDVTDRNRMLRALSLAESEFRDLAENAVDIVATLRVDDDGQVHVEYINRAAATVLGYPLEQLRDEPDLLLSLLHESSDHLDALAMRDPESDRVPPTTVDVRRGDGRRLWLELHWTRPAPSNAPARIQLVARDVTARLEATQALERALDDQIRSAEQLRTLNAMKDTFLQSISHELRTPLTSIMGFAQLLARTDHQLGDADIRTFHTRILDNGQRLQRLLDDLLDIDRFTRGHFEPDRRPTDLAELVRRTTGEVELGAHHVDLDLAPVTMDLDAPWVERVVSNLVRNVVRHTPPGTRATVCTRATPSGAEIIVDDDGPGIPTQDRQRVVEPFQQGVHTSSTAQPGTGLGLALVSTFAQLHGGSLEVAESTSGGARIIVTLAHVGSDDGPPPTDAGEVPATSPPAHGAPDRHAPLPGATADAERVTNEALRQLLQALTADQVRGVVLSVVHRLGGWTVPARLADDTALPIDVSFGIDDPLLPCAEPGSPERATLERHVPRLVEDARRALENLARTDQFAHDASVDPLTGLLSRRAYERILPRLGPDATVVVLDLDGFKPVNDTHGHEAGDQILRAFGATVRSVTRATDHACRIGGDEFALLLEGTSAAQATRLVGRLRSRWEDRRPQPVGFSVGIAVVSDDPAAAVAAADQAMYDAKRSPRDEPVHARPATMEGTR